MMENMIYCFQHKSNRDIILKTVKNILLKAYICLFTLTALNMPSFAADVLNLPNQSIKGKFEMISDGLIQIKEKGISKTYIRKDNPFDIYADYISYTASPFSKELQSGPCKVILLDTFNLTIKLPDSSSIKIPRYRVKDLEINIK